MENITFEEIKELWKTNTKPVQVYIHSAFCKSQCSFCAYSGALYKKDIYDKYFYEYLPNQIDNYKDILRSQKIHGIYFGGGTPNMESDLNNLKPAFERVRDINCNEKIIELHMGLPITDETIEVLKKENFNTVMLCQQTFDKEKLKQEHRVNSANNNLDKLISKFHNANINVGLDLIAFLDDHSRIIKDIAFLKTLENKPDEISVPFFYGSKPYFWLESSYEDLSDMGYCIVDLPKNDNEQLSSLYSAKDFRFVLKSKLSEYRVNFYSFPSDLKGKDSYYTSTLGIGSYPNMLLQTFSRISNTIYTEQWNYKEAIYKVLKIKSLKEALLDYINSLPSNFEIPTNSNITFHYAGLKHTPDFSSGSQVFTTEIGLAPPKSINFIEQYQSFIKDISEKNIFNTILSDEDL